MTDDMTWKEIKRKVGEMSSMENDLRQAQVSRDYWKAKCKGLERGLCERYAELPTDSCGSAIHRGCHVRVNDGETWEVRSLVLGEDGWLLDCIRPGDLALGRTFAPIDCRVWIVEQRTVEDVLREFAEAIEGQNEDFGSLIVKRYADEIRQMLDGR